MTKPADQYGLLLFAQRPSIGPITLNCTLSETHGSTYTMTDMPIEDGSVLTDHRIRDPIVLELEGVITPQADSVVTQFAPGTSPSPETFSQSDEYDTVWSRLRAYADDPRPSQVITALETYESMLPVAFSHTEDGRDGIIFQMTLRQIEVARVRREQFVAADFQARVEDEDNLGQQGSRELSPEQQEAAAQNFSDFFAGVGAAI
jgi:hypothetical protein